MITSIVGGIVGALLLAFVVALVFVFGRYDGGGE